MRRNSHRWLLGLAACGGSLLAGEAKAQAAPGAAATSPANGMMNPYMNPYANPYLNPALTAGNANRNDALLYLWAAQQQPGGLLGPRATRTTPTARAAEMPKSAMRPGGGASRFFNRGPSTPAGAENLGRRYQRFNRYYSNNGR